MGCGMVSGGSVGKGAATGLDDEAGEPPDGSGLAEVGVAAG